VGILESGEWTEVDPGMPQRAAMSPPLADIYPHYGFDLQATQWRWATASGQATAVRHANDSVLGFQMEYAVPMALPTG
jgi:RNA-directed DNA polymerase